MQTLKKKNQGFTIIEVVLVLAIAGLIFLIVFLALPRLQRSRRDTQRKGDVGTIVSQLENFAGNNNSTYPRAVACAQAGAGNTPTFFDFLASYAKNLNDPSTGVAYKCIPPGTAPAAAGEVEYQLGVSCPGHPTATNNTIAVTTYLESGGNYCQGNN